MFLKSYPKPYQICEICIEFLIQEFLNFQSSKGKFDLKNTQNHQKNLPTSWKIIDSFSFLNMLLLSLRCKCGENFKSFMQNLQKFGGKNLQ